MARWPGLSVRHVEDVRENTYGTLADPELDALRRDLRELEGTIAEDRRQLDSLAREMRAKHDERLADLQRRLAVVEARTT